MRNVLLGLGNGRLGNGSQGNGGPGNGSSGNGGRPGRAARSTPQAHAPAGRHRFAQDGDVPVVRLSLARTETTREPKWPAPAPEPVATDPAERDRAARHAAERALQEMTTTLHGVQTRLGHAELDLEQASSQVRARDQELQVLRAELRLRSEELAAARHALDAASRRRAAQTVRPSFDAMSYGGGFQGNGAEHAAEPPRGLSAGAGQDDDAPEPVKWWRD